MEAEHFPMTQRFGLGNLVWSPLEGGWLAGKYRKGHANPLDTPRAVKWVGDLGNPKFAHRMDVVEELLTLAEEKGTSLARFALKWTLRHPAVTSTIIGPRTREQLEDAIASLDVTVTDEDAGRVDALVPPGTSAL
jgi:aryl-alcohol dehydrogenase-like predicted oxidoreductase